MSGSLAQRFIGAENLFCRSAAFRTRVGAADELAAKTSVYVGELHDVVALAEGQTLAVKRPGVVLGVESHGYVQVGQGSALELIAVGGIWALFLDNPANPTDHKASLFAFTDWVSSVLDEMATDVGRDVQWPFIPRMFLEPFRPDVADRQSDDYWAMGYVLRDMIEGGSR